MRNYFNVPIEFDKKTVDEVIQTTIANKGTGFVCSVEANIIATANRDPNFMNVVRNALVNICDGSMIAAILSRIHGKPLRPYIGADLFTEYVNLRRYRQFFIGNTREVLDGLRANLSKIDPAIDSMRFEELPFRKVDEFDYPAIAGMINAEKPDIIWVSLGAPKQEEFMYRLEPFLDQGVMFGFGAIFNFNAGAGHVRRAPATMRRLKLEWLYRAFEEPKKNVPRYWNFLRQMPKLVAGERRAARN